MPKNAFKPKTGFILAYFLFLFMLSVIEGRDHSFLSLFLIGHFPSMLLYRSETNSKAIIKTKSKPNQETKSTLRTNQ
jgi:hypothetical protein